MASQINFTKSTLSALEAASKRIYFKDTNPKSPRGFGMYVTPAGVKCYFLSRTVDGKTKRLAIGRFPDMTIEQARKAALKLAADVANGDNPNAKRQAERARQMTLEDVYEDYLLIRGSLLTANTKSNYDTVMRKHLSDWMGRSLATITGDMVIKKHAGLSTYSKSSANKSMRVLKAIFTFANGQYEDEAGKGLFPDNPVDKLTHLRAWNPEGRRQTVIHKSDLAKWYDAVRNLGETPFEEVVRDYLMFVLLTGLRRREASRLTWADINFDARTVRIGLTKNKKPLILPLPDYLIEMLARRRTESSIGDHVFPSTRKGVALQEPKTVIAKVREASGVYFTLHDLRRTFVTVAESLDISAYAIKGLVNHSSGGDVTKGYIVLDIERLREPMERICSEVLSRMGVIEIV